MKNLSLSGVLSALCLACSLSGAHVASAQSGVGTTAPDADKALHVRAAAGQEPLRLEGLNLGSTEEDVLVTDADGVLRYRPIADLTVSGEWRDSVIAGESLIFAKQATDDGQPTVLTDAGFLGIGTAEPDFALHVIGGAAVTNLPQGDVDRSGTPDYVVTAHPTSGQLRGVDVDDLIQANAEWVVDGTGQYIRARRALENGNLTAVDPRGYFGVGTGTPAVGLDVRVPGASTNALGDGVANIGDGTNFISLDRDDIQAIGAGAVSPLNLNQYGGDVIVGAGGSPGVLDARGRVRVTDLPAGDLDEVGADDEVVTADAAGNLRKVPVSDLNSGEWRDDAAGDFVYAKRARDAGNDVVVRDNGFVGVGTTAPAAHLHVDARGDLIDANGASGGLIVGNRASLYVVTDENEVSAYDASTPSQLNLNADGGNVRIGQNAAGTSLLHVFGQALIGTLPDGDVDGVGVEDRVVVANGTGMLREVDVDDLFDNYDDDDWTANGNDQYSAVSGNVGIGDNTPTFKLDVNGTARFRNLPTGNVGENDPTLDDWIVLADRATNQLKRIRPSDLFDDEGEWNFESGGTNPDRIYARRAREDGSQNVVVDELGRLGLGTNTPDEKLELEGGGIQVTTPGFGIGFNGTAPYAADPSADPRDGGRVYLEPGALGGSRDAFIIEKTDRNDATVDGGIVFANRAEGNTRVLNVIIDRDGDLGVKTMQPRQPLHVFGTALFQTGAAGADAAGGIIRVGDDQGTLPWATRGVQVRDQGDYAYFGLRQDAANRMDAVALWGNNNQEDFRFIQTDGTNEREVMTLAGDNRFVGIGQLATNPQRQLEVGGRVRVQDLYALNGDVDGNGTDDRIVVSAPNGDLQSISASDLFKDFEDEDWAIAGDDIYNANARAVGIGVTGGFGGAYKLEVLGDTRLRGATRLVLRDANSYLFSPNSGDLTVHADDRTVFEKEGGPAAAANPLTVEHGSRTVGIGVDDPANGLALEIEGNSRVRNTSELRFGADDDNMLYAAGNNDFRVSAQRLFSVRSRGDGTGILSVRTDQRRVGVGLNNPAVGFDVDERVRLRDLPFGDGDNDFFVTADNDGDLRRVQLSAFEGPWVREPGSPAEVYPRELTDYVGIGTNNPAGALHVREATGTAPNPQRGTITLEHRDDGGTSSIVFKSEQDRNDDYGYISYTDDGAGNGSSNQNGLLEIGVRDDGPTSNNRDHVALQPSGYVGVKTNAPTAALDVDGRLRVRDIPDVNEPTDFAVTVDAAGNVRRQPVSAVKDNLGNHQMEQTLNTNGFAIRHTGTGTGQGLVLTPENSAMFSNRLQIGSTNPSWIDDALSGVQDGMHGNDGAVFAATRSGARSDLRLYILDNADDEFSIWGNPCATTDCGAINSSSRVARFRADGQITLPDLATGGGPDQMVVADANGVLSLGGVPGSGTTGGGDNLGNHVATQNIILGSNDLVGQNNFRFEGDDGNIRFPNGGAMYWNSIFQSAISGGVDANGDGNNRDIRIESDDDVYARADGDWLVGTNGIFRFASDNGYRFSAGQNGADDDFRFFTDATSNNPANGTNKGTERFRIQNDGEIQVFDLAGGGDRVVMADDNGVLYPAAGTTDGLWERDPANGETYLANAGDRVGIGTADPVADVHLRRAQAQAYADPANTTTLRRDPNGAQVLEMRLDNPSGNGGSSLFFMEGNNPDIGFRLTHDGVALPNQGGGRFDITRGDGRHYVSIERTGQMGIGEVNPQAQLHVTRTALSGAGAGYVGPARIRIQNEANEGSSGLEFVENAGEFTPGRGMSLRYVGSENQLQVIRGPVDDPNPAYINLRIDRNSGLVTVRNLATAGPDEIVVADANGVLSTQAFTDDIWDKDDTDSEVFLGAAASGYRVGIGTDAPTSTLHVGGDLRVGSLGTGLATDFVVTSDATGVLRQRPASDFENYWDRDAAGNGTNAYLFSSATDDLVGIGTNAPQAKLDVDGDLRIGQLGAGVAGTDVLLVADANGTVKQIPANSYDDHWNRVEVGAQEYVELTTASDFVGIGTAGVPAAQFHTTGSVRFEDLANVAGGEMVMADANGDLYTQAVADELWSRTGTVTSLLNLGDQVGIGTAAPAAGVQLDVAGRLRVGTIDTEAAGDRIVTIGADGVLRQAAVGTYNSPWRYVTGTTGDVQLKDLTGDVGVGTALPEAKLHVYGNAGGDATELLVHNNAANGSSQIRLRERANSPEANSMLLRYNGGSNRMEFTNGWASATGSVRTDSLGTHMVIMRGNGRVGINLGDVNPTDQLHVDGNVRLEEGHRIQFEEDDSYLDHTAGGDLDLRADRDLELLADDDVNVRGVDNVNVNALGRDLNLRGGDDINLLAVDELIFRPGNQLRATYHQDGRLEIRDAPAANDLDVVGKTYTRQIRIQNGAGNGRILQSDGAGNGTWVEPATVPGDNLGDHAATQAIALNANWLSNDGDAEGLRVDDDGNVGLADDRAIGFADPGSRLADAGTGDVLLAAADSLRLTSAADVSLAAANELTIATDGTERVRVHQNGRFELIGSPAGVDLDVKGRVRTEQFQLTDGATAGYLLRSVNDLGVAEWADPATLGDGLGDHVAKQNLVLDGHYLSGDGQDEGVFVNAAGGVGIGTNAIGATQRLAVAGNSVMNGNLAVVGSANVLALGVATNAAFNGSVRLAGVPTINGTDDYNYLFVDAAGEVHVGDQPLSPLVTSDRRLKRDVTPFEGVLEQLDLLNTVTYRYRDDVADYAGALDTAIHYGIIAQDVAGAFPHAVTERADGYLAVEPNELIGVLLAAAKDLKMRNENLEEQVYHMMNDKAALERTVDGLQAQTAELETGMATVLQYVEAQAQTQAGGE